jgi:hypothetical protein
MYLVIPGHSAGVHTAYQTPDLRTDSHFLGWVHDTHATVVRHENGRFERMVVYTEAAEYNPRLLRFKHRWQEFKTEDV